MAESNETFPSPVVHIHRPADTGAEIVAMLKATLAKPNSTLVGVAIGIGMAALAATRGGADFILALNAGRLRSMGAPSICSHCAKAMTSFLNSLDQRSTGCLCVLEGGPIVSPDQMFEC